MKTHTNRFVCLLACLPILLSILRAEDVVPAAILPFNERGHGVKGEGEKIAPLLFAELITQPNLFLVEREELQKVVTEHELNLSGMVRPGEAVLLGQLTGARILITGSVIEAGESKYVVAKIIGTETSRVLGASVEGPLSENTASLTKKLSGKVAETLTERSGDLLPKMKEPRDRVQTLTRALEGKELPVLSIHIQEEHVGRNPIDPAAETEMQYLAKASGFSVVEPGGDAEIRLVGEAFSEFAMRRGNLISVKARVEVKALDRENNVVAIDRQTRVAVDLAEHVAAKAALQEAAADIAERLLVKLAD